LGKLLVVGFITVNEGELSAFVSEVIRSFTNAFACESLLVLGLAGEEEEKSQVEALELFGKEVEFVVEDTDSETKYQEKQESRGKVRFEAFFSDLCYLRLVQRRLLRGNSGIGLGNGMSSTRVENSAKSSIETPRSFRANRTSLKLHSVLQAISE